MRIDVQLFGALRGLEPGDRLQLEMTGTSVADARQALVAYAGQHWPASHTAMLGSCALASNTMLLRDGMPVPDDGGLVVLPPVNGG